MLMFIGLVYSITKNRDVWYMFGIGLMINLDIDVSVFNCIFELPFTLRLYLLANKSISAVFTPILKLVLVFLCVCEEYERIEREDCVGVMQKPRLQTFNFSASEVL